MKHRRVGVLLAAALTAAPTAQAQEIIGNFVYQRSADPLTDSDRSFITTIQAGSNALRHPALIWSCVGSSIALSLASDEYLNSEGWVPVQWRFDNAPAVGPVRWQLSADGTMASAVLPDIVEFTDGARPATSVFLRVPDFRGVSHDFRFSLVGLSQALTRLSCAPALERMRPGPAPAIGVRRAEAQYVGNPSSKTYSPMWATCAAAIAGSPGVVFFGTFAEAERNGYRLDTVCFR